MHKLTSAEADTDDEDEDDMDDFSREDVYEFYKVFMKACEALSENRGTQFGGGGGVPSFYFVHRRPIFTHPGFSTVKSPSSNRCALHFNTLFPIYI